MPDQQLPQDWREVPIGSLGTFFRGRGGTRADEEVNGLPCIRYGDLYTHHDCIIHSCCSAISPARASAYTLLHPGDIVFAGSGETFEEIGKAAAYCGDGQAYAGGDTIIFRPCMSLDSHFAGYAVNSESANRHKSKMGQGSSVIHISVEHLSCLPLRLPPVDQQQHIAETLTTLDKAIEKTEALIAKYQQIKAGLMHDLFTRGVTADGKLRLPSEQAPELYQETSIGWIPKEWQYELLDQLAVRGSGHTPNKNFPEYWNGGIKWISLADSYRLDRLYITDTEYEISQLGIQNSSATVHPAGTVVISRDAGIGKSAITTEPMAVSQHFMCWRCDARLDNHFLYYWLQFKKRMFENIAMGSTILTIGLPYFKKLKIAAPIDPEEQKRIGEGLLNIDRKIFSLEADLEKKRQQKSGLMHDLLTGCVHVKVT